MSTASFVRDYERARERHPAEVRRLENYLERLRADFPDTFAHLRQQQQLLCLDESTGLYELVHEHRKSKVCLLLECDEEAERVTILAVIQGAGPPRHFLEDNAQQETRLVPRHHIGALDAEEQSRAPSPSPPTPDRHDESCFWGFGFDHSKPASLRRSA